MEQDSIHIDYSFLDSFGSSGDKFRKEVIEIFLANTPANVDELGRIIDANGEWDDIYRQAHFLKSGFSVIKIEQINELLVKIESLAKKEQKREEIEASVATLISIFNRAIPILKAELES